MRIYECYILFVENKQYDVFCNMGCRLLLYNFLIFLKNLIGDAKLELT